MTHEKGSYGGHSGGLDLTGALTRANVVARNLGGGGNSLLPADGSDGAAIDSTLHASEGTMCFSCGAPLSARDDVRVTPHGTRHDSCP